VTGTASLDEALLSASQKGLQVIPCGPLPQNAVELLESDAMPQLLETLSQRADLVIVDAPPVLAVADARILASLVDATLLVVEVNGTRRSEARMAKEFLRRSNARVVGMVANRVRTGAAAYHYVQGE
jgi:capsular exopolysaccharide synthesis family protein